MDINNPPMTGWSGGPTPWPAHGATSHLREPQPRWSSDPNRGKAPIPKKGTTLPQRVAKAAIRAWDGFTDPNPH